MMRYKLHCFLKPAIMICFEIILFKAMIKGKSMEAISHLQ